MKAIAAWTPCVLACVLAPALAAALAAPAAGASCAASYEQLAAATSLLDVVFGRKGKLALTVRDGCVTSGGKTVAARLLRIPDAPRPLGIVVSVSLGKHFVVPRVDLLGADFKTLRSISGSDFTHRGEQISAELFVNPSDTAARFVAISVDPQHLGDRDTSLSAQATTTFVGTGYTGGRDDRRTAIAAESGQVRISLDRDQVDALQQQYEATIGRRRSRTGR